MHKYKVLPGPYFPAFKLNTGFTEYIKQKKTLCFNTVYTVRDLARSLQDRKYPNLVRTKTIIIFKSVHHN